MEFSSINKIHMQDQFGSVTQSCPTLCDPMDGLQHPRLPCPSPAPRAYSNSCPLHERCHPTISSCVIPFSSCLQSFPASRFHYQWLLVQFSSVTQSCLTLCNPIDSSTPGLPVHHQLPEPTQTHVHCISDAIQPSHPPLSPSPPAFNLSQHQGSTTSGY